jgi:hypothetical protein
MTLASPVIPRPARRRRLESNDHLSGFLPQGRQMQRENRRPDDADDTTPATVVGAPRWLARAPASAAPKGAIPMNIIEYTAITRPRNSFETSD